MKLFKRVSILLLAGMLLFGGLKAFSKPEVVVTEKEQIRIEERLDEQKVKIDMERIALEQRILASNKAIDSIEDNVSINLLTVRGSEMVRLNLDEQNTKLGEYFFGSEVDLKLDYHARYFIETDNIKSYVDSGTGMLVMSLDARDIIVDGISVDSHYLAENRGVWGDKLSNEQLVGLIESTSQGLIRELNDNTDYKHRAMGNLKNVIKDLAIKQGVELISLDGGTTSERLNIIPTKEYEMPKQLTNGIPINDYSNEVVYGVNKQKLSEVKAIVLHSTSNPNVGVKGHINWSKNDKNALMVSYYIDSKEVGKTFKDGYAGFGIKDYNGYTNDTVVNIEICESDNPEIQQKAIDNAILLVKELMKQYPQAEITTHRNLSSYGKSCPRILIDDKDKMKNFENKLGKELTW